MTAKLIAISPPEYLRNLVRALPSSVVVDSPIEVTCGWMAVIRGPVVRFVSPPGWVSGRPAAERDLKGPRQVLEAARAQCALHWQIDVMADLEKLDQHESPAFGPGAHAVVAAAVEGKK